jgi:hypothetical protein
LNKRLYISRDSLDMASSIGTFWHVFYCQLKCQVYWQKLTAFLSIHSGNKQWKAQFIVMWPSKTGFCCWHINSRILVQDIKVWSLHRRCHNSFNTYTAFIRNIPWTELLHVFSNKSSMYMHLDKEGPFLTSVVTKINMKNVFYYKPSEYAQTSQ